MNMATLDDYRLNGSDGPPDPAIETNLKSWLAVNAGEARMYTALGIAARQGKDEDYAIKLFESALKLSRVEQYALTQMLLQRARGGQFAEAMQYVDVYVRRWPERRSDLYSAIRTLSQVKEGYATMMKQAQTSVTLRSTIIQALAENSETLPQLYSAILEMKNADPPPSEKEINLTIDRLIMRNDPDAAYRLFLLTLNDNERQRAGTIFNGKLRTATTSKRFDWQVKETKGLDITLPYGGGGALFRFYDRPVTRIEFSQILLLKPGSYVVTTSVSAEQLNAPRNLFLTMRCVTGNELAGNAPAKDEPKDKQLSASARDLQKDAVQQDKDLMKVVVPTDSYQQERLKSIVVVPEDNCTMQRIAVVSGLNVETWSVRYNGSLLLNSIDIERSQQ